MFRFAHPAYLYLLLLILVFSAAYIILCLRQRKLLKKFGELPILQHLMQGVSAKRRHLKFFLMMLALALIIFVLARPQFGSKTEEVKRNGIEAMIAVDVSNSMLCEDVSPSRLMKAKMLISKLVDQLDEDKVGLVAFAGSAVTLLPMTADQASAKMFLDQLSPSTVAVQGTDIAQAITRTIAGFFR